ncbi:MAG: hypothetical protein CSA36_08235 [Draconibacterium sp.]|nr:MAG: hypothetical protein CSA36_08235 [Draconibacterium sp.]
MNFILDDKETNRKFLEILRLIKLRQNGDVSETMRACGISYKVNWGVSLPELRELAQMFEPSHLLAMKLWNKLWRETMILSTMLDEPSAVTEEMMDFRTRNFENTEIVEQASANLWVKTPFAFAKALEWCRGKKHLVRYTAVHLIGRLALTQKKAIDEMFEPFFEELVPLAKDKTLFTPLYRSIIAIGTRSHQLNGQCVSFSETLRSTGCETAEMLGSQLLNELTSTYLRETI